MIVRLPVLGLLLVASVGCATPGHSDRARLAVYAASSLTEAFGEMKTAFEATHPDADVSLTFAGSQALRLQIEQGAPADVVASANPEHLTVLVEQGLVSEPQVFAHNDLVVIVPSDNPAGLTSFFDLPSARRLVLGTPEVPAGRYARRAIAAADAGQPGFESAVMTRLVSEEANVRLARSKVELGEADAAIVYRTDAMASSRIRMIAMPPDLDPGAEYLIGLVAREARSDLAQTWIDLVTSTEGQMVLAHHGFVTSAGERTR